ncbi:MAG: acyl-CoA dehydrogenase family protein [Candidatus Altiarchaeota archaeon]
MYTSSNVPADIPLKEIVKKEAKDRQVRMTGSNHPLFALLPGEAREFQEQWFDSVGDTVSQFGPCFMELDAAGLLHDGKFLEKVRKSLELMKESGFFGLGVPEQYGGVCDEGMLPTVSTVTANMQIARIDPGLMITSAVSGGLGIGSFLFVLKQAMMEAEGKPDDGTVSFIQGQIDKWGPKIAAGDVIAGFALTEPNVGSDAAAIQTKAVKGKLCKVGEKTEFVAERGEKPQDATDDGVDGYQINGVKQFITNGPLADMVLVFAKTGPEAERNKNVGLFIVEKDEPGRPGFTVGTEEKKTGLLSSTTSQIILDDVFVPAENLVGGPAWERRGFEIATGILQSGRLNVAAQATGVSRRALEEMARYTNQRIQFGGKLYERPGVEYELQQMEAIVEAQTALLILDAQAKDGGVCSAGMASRAKLFCTDMCQKVTRTGVQLHGGYGFSREYPIEVLNRAAGVFTIYEGANEINGLVSAKELIKGGYPRLGDFKIDEGVLRAKGLAQSVSELEKVEKLVDETLKRKDELGDAGKIALSRIAATGDAMRALLIAASQREADTGGFEDNTHLFCTRVALKMVDGFKHDLYPPTERARIE